MSNEKEVGEWDYLTHNEEEPDPPVLKERTPISLEIQTIEENIAAIEQFASVDLIAETRNRLGFIFEEYKRTKKIYEEALILIINLTKRDIILPGNIRLYVGA